MKFICEFFGGAMDGVRIPVEDAEKLTDRRSQDLSAARARGSLVHREELDNRPEFKGYAGPMWDGERPGGIAILRYESWPVYEMMSR